MKWQKGAWILPVVLLAAYCNSFGGPFIFDDVQSIPGNRHIRHLWPIWEACRSPIHTTLAGRPFVTLTMALNYAVSGSNVWSYHLVNLALHVTAVLLVFGIVRRTLQCGRLSARYGAEASGIALAVALLWGLHPLLNESVVYIVQRTELMMGCSLLLMIYALIRAQSSSRPIAWYTVSSVACIVGMGCKEVMVVAPLLAICYDRVYLSSSWRELIHRRWVLYASYLLAWGLLAVLVATTPRRATGFYVGELTPWKYLLTETGVIVHYLRLAIWPDPLCLCYADWPIASHVGQVLWQAVVVVALFGLSVWAIIRLPALGFMGVAFFLILGPTSSVLPSAYEVMAERRMYLALLPAVVVAALLGRDLTVRLVGRLRPPRQTDALAITRFTLVAVLCAVCISANLRRSSTFRTSVSIWTDTVTKRPDNWRAHCGLGGAFLDATRLDDAIPSLETAIRLRWDCREAYLYLGIALARQGRLDEAITRFQTILQHEPDDREGLFNLGWAMYLTGHTTEAMDCFQRILRIEPGDDQAMVGLGNVYSSRGNTDEAIRLLATAIEANPENATAYVSLGTVLANQGQHAQALACDEQSLKLDPENANAHANMAGPLLELGRVGDAIAHCERALHLDPSLYQAHFGAASGLLRLGRVDAAVAHLEQAIAAKPDFAEATALLTQVRASQK